MFKKLSTNMMVEDVGRTLKFYQNVLGFDFVLAVPQNSQQILAKISDDTPLGFAIVQKGDVQMMFQSRKSLEAELPVFKDAKVGGSVTFYLEVEDVKALYAQIKDKVTIVKDMHTTFYGMQEFYICDCNGYVLTFAGKE